MELFAGVLISLLMCGAFWVLCTAFMEHPKAVVLVLSDDKKDIVTAATKMSGVDALLILCDEPKEKEIKKISRCFSIQKIRKENTDGAGNT